VAHEINIRNTRGLIPSLYICCKRDSQYACEQVTRGVRADSGHCNEIIVNNAAHPLNSSGTLARCRDAIFKLATIWRLMEKHNNYPHSIICVSHLAFACDVARNV